MKLNPLQQAIIDDNLEAVDQLKDSEWRFALDAHGFNPLELAELLGKTEIQRLLIVRKPKTIKIQLKDQETPSLCTVKEFESTFNITYNPFISFFSYEELEKIIDNCPYFLRYQWLFGKKDGWETSYQEILKNHLMAKTYIKWIDPVLEYGLFADADLPDKAFIGEYTGNIRQLDKKEPDINGYCFHYPTKCFSLNYYVIDALYEGNMLRFINHSEKPNLQPLWLVDRGVLHLVFIANQLITKGTELTFNYGKDYWKYRQKV